MWGGVREIQTNRQSETETDRSRSDGHLLRDPMHETGSLEILTKKIITGKLEMTYIYYNQDHTKQR